MQKNFESKLFLHSINAGLVVLAETTSIANLRRIPINMIESITTLQESRAVWVSMPMDVALLFGLVVPATTQMTGRPKSESTVEELNRLKPEATAREERRMADKPVDPAKESKPTTQRIVPKNPDPKLMLANLAKSKDAFDDEFPGLSEAVAVAVANESHRQFSGITNVIYSIRDELREIAKNGIRV